ncbi:uncharacterized protein ChaoS9_065 [Halobacterium phage ChaoS9]|uniref:Uncharacterized protein n=1 Tax=Halobacterium phage ChaoS9 TaxID=2847105 RepID=A0A481V9R7_9CAUD|nr:uncharacterized protein KMC41_gp14 [Halobacterium phage ChaoS9]QBI90020.1 uncharacterized protein ChaoS9_065 [Halobacterium phage ChaoS9]
MIEDYEDLNRDETLEAVDDVGAERLQAFIDFERQHKNRKTVIEPLKRELIRIRPADPARQYVAGVWFDEPATEQIVRRSHRIDRAIEDGDLVEVE